MTDGEAARESFFTYIRHRMTGFGATSRRKGSRRQMIEHPDFLELMARRSSGMTVSASVTPTAVGPIEYHGTAEVDAECALLQNAPFTQTFMTAVSPGMVAAALNNQHYSSDEDYLRALGRALSVEYRVIVARGLLLQIDAPDLAADRSGVFSELSLAEYMRWAEMVVDTINSALEGIEPQRVRLHVCWGNMEAPHTHDVALEDILGTLYRAHVGALVISMANPRHSHEYKCFARHPLPDGMKLVAGVIDSTTNYVEHPEVVADRLERVATAVGDPTRIMAGTDCGFASLAGYTPVAPSIVWKKLSAMRAGADLAAARLF